MVKNFINKNILWLIVLLLAIIYSSCLIKTPLLSAGDVLHQSWIAGEIADTGTIPIQNPMTGNFDILSLSPLFQILGAQLSLLTGIHEIYIYVALNFLLIPMLCLGFYLVTRKLFLNETIALLAVLIFFSLNSATYISRHISFFVIKEATIAIFLVFCILYLTITLLKHQGRYQVRLLALYGTLVAVTALTHQFTTFSIVSILVSLYVLLFVLYPQLRKKILLLGSIVFVAIIIVFLLNANLLFYPETGYLTTQQHTFTKDFTESSAVSSNDLRSSYLSSVFDDAYHPLLLLCAVFGGIFFIIVQKKSAREMPAHLFIPAVWIITFFILALQPIGNFQLLPTRFLHWTIIPLAIIAGYGLYFLLLSFKRSSIQLSLLAALVIIPLTMSITLNADSFDSTENISFKELESYVRIHTILADSDNKTVVSDPFFGYKLITISGAQLTYRYERTGMYRDDSLEFDAVKKFIYSDPESAYDYASSSGAKYIAINYDDKHRYYEEADYAKLDDADRYRRIVHEYPGSMDEISIYEIVPRNKDSLR